MKKIMNLLAVVALVFAFAASAMAADKVVKPFKIKTADGKEFNQESIKGKKVAFVFAQMACGQCRAEMDELNTVADKLKGKLYLVLVDMNVEGATKLYEKKGYKLDLLIDPEFDLPTVFEMRTTPATIVVNEKGVVTFEKVGYAKGELEDILKAIN